MTIPAEQPEKTRGHIFDLIFLVGVVFKGLDGLVEFIAGVSLLFLSPARIAAVVQHMTAQELIEDPHDFIANLLINGTNHLTEHTIIIAGIYLLIHGIVKLVIVIALILGVTKIYPWAIGALSVLTIIQIVQFVSHPTLTLAFFTIFDIVIIALTWREWRQKHTLRETFSTTMQWFGSLRSK